MITNLSPAWFQQQTVARREILPTCWEEGDWIWWLLGILLSKNKQVTDGLSQIVAANCFPENMGHRNNM